MQGCEGLRRDCFHGFQDRNVVVVAAGGVGGTTREEVGIFRLGRLLRAGWESFVNFALVGSLVWISRRGRGRRLLPSIVCHCDCVMDRLESVVSGKYCWLQWLVLKLPELGYDICRCCERSEVSAQKPRADPPALPGKSRPRRASPRIPNPGAFVC